MNQLKALVKAIPILIFSCAFNDISPEILDRGQGIVTFRHFEYLSDPDGTISFNDIIDGKYDGQFKMQGKEKAYEPDKKAWWVKFKVKNITDLDEEWVFNFQNWSHVDFYYRKDNGEFQLKKTGHLMPFNKRDYPVANYSYVSIVLQAGFEYECIARLDPEFNGLIQVTDLEFTAANQNVIVTRNSSSMILTCMFLGMYLIMLLYNGFLYYTTQEKEYRFYLATLLLLLLNLMGTSGLLISLTSYISIMPQISKVYNYVEPQLLGLASILFLADFFHVKQRYANWYKLLKIELYFMIFVIMLLLINFKIGLAFAVFNSIPVLVLVFSIAIKSLRDSYPSSLLFLIGHIFWFVGAIVSMLSKIGAIPATDFGIMHAFALGSSIEMILFSMALGNRINALKQENEKKQISIIHHLMENEQLQTKVNRELEQKVKERTEEINDQKEEISNQKKYLQTEKDRSERLLLNILPKEIAEELKLNGHATPRYYEQVSILFVDIQGFSMMVEKISPNDLVKDLDYCFTGFDYIIGRHNLEKIKTIGDSYMCVGGIPVPNKTHAIDAVKASLEMVEFVKKWKEENPVLGENGLNLRLGINTGPIISGVVGKKKFQYDVWGEAVNLASRMESASEAGKVNISASTYSLVKDLFNCQYRGKLSIKNMGEADMYFVN